LLPAWILSIGVHVVLAVLLFSMDFRGVGAPATETASIASEVEDNQKLPNLENDDVGLDPNVETNYNSTRIEPISVPGVTNMADPVGIPNAPEGPPMTLPPPPGLSSLGTGGGLDDPSRAGAASLSGLPGGFGAIKPIPGGFAGRSAATRAKLVEQGGGNTQSEAAVAAGLKWLANHQTPDGHWSLRQFHQHGGCNCTGFGNANNDVAATAFGLLPFLGAGQTHRATTDKGNRYSRNVDKGLRYLISRQNKDGGFVVKGSSNSHMYAHGLAAIAMCEAYALTSDPELRRPAQRALNYIVAAQTPEGGWRYEPRGQTGFDTSVGGWQVMALKSGQLAGLDVPSSAFAAASRWLNAAQSPDGGGYGYVSEGETETMTAVGLLCRQYLGWGPRQPGLIAGVRRLRSPMPNNMYYNYYATQVLHHFGGDAWQLWNRRMRDQLIESQDKGTAKPHQKGSWEGEGDFYSGRAGGRIMATSLSLLTLEVYYRHLPLYRHDAMTAGGRGAAAP
jgi:prenyltransferase beta subunit